MKIESLNCPNCGAGVLSDKTVCEFCRSRLKTMACASCLGLMFVGSKFCGHCGEKVIAVKISEEKIGDCPRCKVKLRILQIGETNLRECEKCDGLWIDVETFEEVCANHEKQAEVLRVVRENIVYKSPAKIQYVPCPDCRNLMNRNNFARVSGVVIDICKQHGVWCDAEELPRIIEFIRRGGLDHARHKEKLQLEEQRKMLVELQQKTARENARFSQNNISFSSPSTLAIREFVRFLFD
ncbi:MAG: zf-TFIIB domain-containing protein [Pyrinomonadaceae bacterium]